VETSGASGTTTQTFNLGNTGNNNVVVDWLAYYAPIKLGKDSQIQTYLAAYGGIHSDYTPTLNPFFEDYDGGNGALSTFASENPIYRIGGGAGAGLSYKLGFLEGLLGPSTLTVGYLAGGASSAASPAEGNGIFNGDYAALAQLNFNMSDTVALGFTYVNAFQKADTALFGGGGTNPIVGTTFANQSASGLNDRLQSAFPGATVDQQDKIVNSYGSQFAWRITDAISFSAFFNYTNLTRIGRGSDDIWSYGGGFAFPDLGKEGSLLGIFAGVQPYNASPLYFITDGNGDSRRVRVSSTTLPVHIEAFYKYQLTDNISLTPGVIWVNSTNQGQNDDQIIGTLRTTFTF
jgi:hypothetical protein